MERELDFNLNFNIIPEHTTISTQPQNISAAASDKILPSLEFLKEDNYKESLQRLPVQRKLSIGASDDPLEEEADTMADKVMRMPETSFIQRKCAHCEEDEKLQRKPLAPFIQKKTDEGTENSTNAVTNQIKSNRGNGESLSVSSKSFMESRFGADFSDVRIHSNGDSAQLSRELNAQAFTVDRDIYFNSGKYSPETNEGKHLLAHELTHVLQQKDILQKGMIQKKDSPDTKNESRMLRDGVILDLDIGGNISTRELHVSLKLIGQDISITFKHTAGTKSYTVKVTPDNIRTKNAYISYTGSTDGIHPAEIHITGKISTEEGKYATYKLLIIPGSSPGKYGFKGIKGETDIDLSNAQSFELGVPATFEDTKDQIIEQIGNSKKEGGTFRFDYKIGPNKEINAFLYIIKDHDDDDVILYYFSANATTENSTGIQTNPSDRLSMDIPVSFEELDIEKFGETNGSVSYRFLPPQYARGFMVTYEMKPTDPKKVDPGNAVHRLNVYPIDTATNTILKTLPVSGSFKQKKGEWYYGAEGRTIENFRIESARHAVEKLAEIKLPKNEIVSLQNEMSFIVMTAVKEKISSPEIYTHWMEFAYGVVAFGEEALKGDVTAKQWLNDKSDVFIKGLVNEIGSTGDIETVNAHGMGYGGGSLVKSYANKYTGSEYHIDESISLGKNRSELSTIYTQPFNTIRTLIANQKYAEAILAIRNSYYLWVEDQLINNSNKDKTTKEKFQAYGYQLSYRRRLRERLMKEKKSLQKIKALYYPDLGNITDEKEHTKYAGTAISAIPLDVYYQDTGDEWVIYNFTTLTEPGKLNAFQRTWTKGGGEFAPPQGMFDLLTHDKGLGKGYIQYQTEIGEGGIVRIDHPWTLGEVLLTVGAVVGLIALALTGVGLLAEGAAAASIGGAAVALGDIAAITVAVGAGVKLAEDYSQGAPITGASIGLLALDITTALLPVVRTLRGIASLRQYKGLFILMDIAANSQILAKLNAAANITGIIVTTAKGVEEISALSKALEEGRIDEATFYWAVFKNVGLGVINLVLLHSDIKTLSARNIGNTTIEAIIKRGLDKKLLEPKPSSMYSKENLEAGIVAMQESSSVYRSMVLEAVSAEKNFEQAVDVLCYLGAKGRGGLDDVVSIDGKLKRVIDVLVEGKFFGKKLDIPQGFTGSKGEALDTRPRDFGKFSKSVTDKVHAVAGMENAEIRLQGSSVIGITKPKVPTEPGGKTWDYDLAIMLEPEAYIRKLAGVHNSKVKYKDSSKGDIDLIAMSNSDLQKLGKRMFDDKLLDESLREFNSEAHTFGNAITTGKANMSGSYFPELKLIKDTMMKDFFVPGMDFSVIAKGSGFDSTPFTTLQ